MAAAIGNQYAAKAKLVTDAIRKAIVQEDGKRLRQGVDKLLDAFASGEPWAIEQVMNRLEGKPAQGVVVSGDEDAPIRAKVSVEFVNQDTSGV